MILDGQFSAQYTDDMQNLTITNTLSNITISDADFTDAYWIGYINFDNLPTFARLSRLTTADNTLTFSDATRKDNVDVLITTVTSTNQNIDTQDYAGFAYFNGTKWDYFPTGGGSASAQRFFNRYDVNTDAATASQLYLAVSVDGVNGELIAKVSITPEEIYNGTFSKTITASDFTTLRGSGPPSDISFDITESEIDGIIKDVTAGSYTLHYVCIGYKDIFARSIRTNGVRGLFYTSPMLSMMIYDDTDDAYVLSVTHPWAEPTWGTAYGILVHSSGAIRDNTYPRVNDIYPGGIEGSVDIATIATVINSGKIAAGTGNIIVQGVTRDSLCMLRRSYVWDDIRRALSLKMRYGDSNTYDNAADKYYTHVAADNEFICELVNAASDFDELRPWQIVGVTLTPNTNRYTEGDRPPYTPGGDDDTPQNVGASITRPSTLGVGGTSGFITQYVLTAAEIATLGRTLWTSFNNPDYWKNFLFSLALDTGSFDMSSLLDYFVSLRVYPFSLINVPSYAATGSPSIFIGSGMVPLTISASTTLHTINNFADYIDAGSCSVHSAYFHDDFRDFSNVEIMLYLPYCGTVQLNPGDVVGGTLHAQYAIDFATGGCVAYVDLTSADGISYPIAVLPGSIGADVPLTATNAGQIAARFAGDVINFASTVSSNAAADLNARANAATGAITGGASGAVSKSSIGAIATGGINAGLQHASQALDMATRPAIGIPTLSGGRGFSSFGAPQTAYIQIRRGIYKRPQTYDHTVGAPSSATKTIGSLAGLVKGAVDTAGLSCMADEAAEVRTLIAAGIIV